jgi:hypothetical protein
MPSRSSSVHLNVWYLCISPSAFRLHLDRNRFLTLRAAAKKLQAVARGFIGREQVRASAERASHWILGCIVLCLCAAFFFQVRVIVTVNTLADELWRLRKVHLFADSIFPFLLLLCRRLYVILVL